MGIIFYPASRKSFPSIHPNIDDISKQSQIFWESHRESSTFLNT